MSEAFPAFRRRDSSPETGTGSSPSEGLTFLTAKNAVQEVPVPRRTRKSVRGVSKKPLFRRQSGLPLTRHGGSALSLINFPALVYFLLNKLVGLVAFPGLSRSGSDAVVVTAEPVEKSVFLFRVFWIYLIAFCRQKAFFYLTIGCRLRYFLSPSPFFKF